jgi:prevent-host-death family protein
MANLMAYFMDMKKVNIAEFKNKCSALLALVEKGTPIQICKRNVPVARVVPEEKAHKNKTILGCAAGTVKIHGDLTEPLIPLEDWEMLREDTNP